MKFVQAITPLLWRVIAFVMLFVVVSGIIGPRVISGGILMRDGFEIYGGVGKAAIFSLISFVLLARHAKKTVALTGWRPGQLAWMLAASLGFIVAWGSIEALLAGNRSLLNLVGAHGGLIACVGLLVMGCFGLSNVKRLWLSYKRELVSAVIIGVAFFAFLTLVYGLWQPLAGIVLSGVMALLALGGPEAVMIPPNTLLFDKFGITVAEFCSGIESIALFTGLYAVVGLLDWPRLNKRRYFIIFPVALLLLFGLNIVRVYGLIMAGYYINPELAFSLFHTYAGMVFFILYSAAFWAVAYKHLLAVPPVSDQKVQKDANKTT